MAASEPRATANTVFERARETARGLRAHRRLARMFRTGSNNRRMIRRFGYSRGECAMSKECATG